jgi:hypothetical protein
MFGWINLSAKGMIIYDLRITNFGFLEGIYINLFLAFSCESGFHPYRTGLIRYTAKGISLNP